MYHATLRRDITVECQVHVLSVLILHTVATTTIQWTAL